MLNANTVTHSHMFRFDVVFRNIGGPSSHFLLAPSFKPTDFKVSGDESQHSNIYLFIFLTLLIILQFYRCTNQGNNYLIGHHRCTFWGHLMIGEAVTIAYNQSLLLKRDTNSTQYLQDNYLRWWKQSEGILLSNKIWFHPRHILRSCSHFSTYWK